MTDFSNLFLCPHCHQPLTQFERIVTCHHRHSFDIAREGYVNLLTGKAAGDSREMLLARRRFLADGYYRPIAEGVHHAAARHLTGHRPPQGGKSVPTILDAGCGEGWYLRTLSENLTTSQLGGATFIGVDNSRDAIRLAARADSSMRFAVADVHQLCPVADGAVDMLLNIFAPRNVAEFARVTAPGGLLLVVIPDPGHLDGLRSLVPLLGIEEGKEERLLQDFSDSFDLQSVTPLQYGITLDGPAIVDLVTMSPTFRHLSRESLVPLLALDQVELDVRVRILAFHRATLAGAFV